jgi:hypothetical protein
MGQECGRGARDLGAPPEAGEDLPRHETFLQFLHDPPLASTQPGEMKVQGTSKRLRGSEGACTSAPWLDEDLRRPRPRHRTPRPAGTHGPPGGRPPAPGGPAPVTHEAVVQLEGRREHPLPPGHVQQHVVRQVRGGAGRPRRGAARTDTAVVAGESELVVVLGGTTRAGSSVRETTWAPGHRTMVRCGAGATTPPVSSETDRHPAPKHPRWSAGAGQQDRDAGGDENSAGSAGTFRRNCAPTL